MIKSRLRSVKKWKGELMHENGFEFEANLKHYQQAVSLMTSLVCSVRIWSTLALLNLCYNCFYYNDLLLIFLQPSTEVSDKILWRLTASQKFKWTGMFVFNFADIVDTVSILFSLFFVKFLFAGSFFRRLWRTHLMKLSQRNHLTL